MTPTSSSVHRLSTSAPSSVTLQRFRSGYYRCLTGWGDALFELTDAALCTGSPVTTVTEDKALASPYALLDGNTGNKTYRYDHTGSGDEYNVGNTVYESGGSSNDANGGTNLCGEIAISSMSSRYIKNNQTVVTSFGRSLTKASRPGEPASEATAVHLPDFTRHSWGL